MTREEAIKRVKGYLTDCLPADCCGEVEEIIEALEQESTTNNDLGVDCISRAEAIKCLECDFDITGKENMKTVVNYINSAHDKIVNLPRVKQEPFINKSCVSSRVCEHDKQKVLDKIRAEIEELDYITFDGITKRRCLEIIEKYKADSERVEDGKID